LKRQDREEGLKALDSFNAQFEGLIGKVMRGFQWSPWKSIFIIPLDGKGKKA
jgi:hypothetical protein